MYLPLSRINQKFSNMDMDMDLQGGLVRFELSTWYKVNCVAYSPFTTINTRTYTHTSLAKKPRKVLPNQVSPYAVLELGWLGWGV
jgi:hypothetical protein